MDQAGNRVMEVIIRSPGCSLEEIVLECSGLTWNQVFTDSAVAEAGEDVLDVSLTGYQAVTPATFRLFGSGASSGGGTFDIEPLTGVCPTAPSW